MRSINVLPKQVAELIAAGEVIERPASVIKELVENSIDAGSHSITVEIQNGGTTYMRVTDDGCGIDREDIKNAFLRHATSKISIQEDLDAIDTLGFRGEALASICAVSRVELMTRCNDSPEGTRYAIDGGEETAFEPVGCPVGTTFVVRDIFYNVPARMKFLKKDVSEGNAVSTLLDRMALSHPEIGFTFIRDGKQTLKTTGDGKLKNAVFQVFGREFTDSLIPVSYSGGELSVEGFVTKPTSSKRANRSMQIFCINGRYVRTKTGMAALEQAYSGMIMTGKYPSCILMLKMNCSMLDVNVHPAKLEVRFTNERPVYEGVYHAVRTAVTKYDTRNDDEKPEDIVVTAPKLLAPPSDRGVQLGFSYGSRPQQLPDAMINRPQRPEIESEPEIIIPPRKENSLMMLNDVGYSAQEHPSAIKYDISRIIDEDEQEVKDTEPVQTEPEQPTEQIALPEEKGFSDAPVMTSEVSIVDEDQREKTFRFIGEAFSTYIIIEYDSERLMLIDKHAAHERLIYERLKKQRDYSQSQLLLEPVSVTLEKEECRIVAENRELLMEAGFEIDAFGDRTILVRSVPVMLTAEEIGQEFAEIADYLVRHRKLILSEKMEWIIANTACRAAVKAGNHSHPEELIDLAMTLEKNPEIRYCPHGRPVYFFMTKHELEKAFRRT